MTGKPISLIFSDLKGIFQIFESWNFWVHLLVCTCVFYVVFPVKMALTLISMLMYSCLHLTLEYVTANYYTGWKIRGLSEVLGFMNKGSPTRHLGFGPNDCSHISWSWWDLYILFVCLFVCLFSAPHFWRGWGKGLRVWRGWNFLSNMMSICWHVSFY